jgi:hypothetical protein
MTQLFDPREIKKAKLPSFPDVEVEIYDGLLTSQIGELDKSTSDYDRGIEVLRFLIKSWSFVDEKGEILRITKENLGKLPARDFTVLMDVAAESLNFLGEEKRKNLKK